MRVRPTVLVIGAGAAGLVSAKRLLDVGVRPIIVERTDRIGGIWNYDDEPRVGSYAYRSLRTNTSRQTMPFADLAFDERLPDFPQRDDVLAYLRRYAETFGLLEHVRFNTTVTGVRRRGDRWRIEMNDRHASTTLEADSLVVCTGIQSEASTPVIREAERFRGVQIHSSTYRTPEVFGGRRVVVVGLGSSGADIAAEAARTAEQVVVSSANGAWLLPRHIAGRPWDHHLTRMSAALPERVRLFLFSALVRSEYRRRGLDPSSRGLTLPPFDPLRSRFTPNSDLLRTTDSPVQFRPGLARVDENVVTFRDGHEQLAEIIVWCTGYRVRFAFLEPGVIDESPDLGLYLNVFPATTDRLAFVGMCVVGGPIFPVMDLQASWVAAVFSGERVLPSAAQMRHGIDWRRRAVRAPEALRVEFVAYMDELGRAAGRVASVPLRPSGLFNHVLGPVRANQYRG